MDEVMEVVGVVMEVVGVVMKVVDVRRWWMLLCGE